MAKITKSQMAEAMAATQASVVFGHKSAAEEAAYLVRNYNWTTLRDAMVRRADRITTGTYRTPVSADKADRVVELALEVL